ncbi:hypothetical protein QIA34_00225 (plasmid) [Borreliella yangtzensis]|uniref:Uncharacterized protein n=1 Tax=Borreliella yangtzensis TaxID=683292 RepID=A0ABR6PCL2_9SPIR|nr:hypothetical protein [Borreliella yangtzensis]MBB6043315.1 hypothetical protein [Borreliella yangtzensis]MBB6043328.1 hypothetical protein [Borreliella yangtzensis]WKC72938.1 hypothetical protein QIA35_00225 [Borreliella yangtzensis]WKC73858.1 hypothetical protein QIA34_00225 [Borreliella yangtzensis]
MKSKTFIFLIFLIQNLAIYAHNTNYEFKQTKIKNLKGIFINYKVYLTDNLAIDNVKTLNHVSTFKINLVIDKKIASSIKNEEDVIRAGNDCGIFLEFQINNRTYYTKFSSIKYILKAIESFTQIKNTINNLEIKNLDGNGIFLYKNGLSYNLKTDFQEKAIFVNFLGFKDNTGRPYFIFYYDSIDNKDKNLKTILISFEEFHNGIREGLFLLRNEKAILEFINLSKD